MLLNKNALYGNKFLNIINGQLVLDEINVNNIVKDYGTPTFVFLKNKIQENIQQIQTSFSQIFPNSKGFYSIKANYLTSIVDIIKNENFGAEIVSLPEFNLLLKMGFPVNNIIAGGPYLPQDYLSKLIQNRVNYIVIYDIEDIPRIESEISKINGTQKIILRFQSPKYTGRQGIPFTQETIDILKQKILECPHVIYKGILSHFGSQLNSIEQYLENIKFLIHVAVELKEKIDLNTEVFDIGGGFPNADSLKKDILLEILKRIKYELGNASFKEEKYTIFYEPGRYIVGDTGFCISKIIKSNSTQSAIYLDIGNTFIPKFMKSTLRFYNISKIQEHPNTPVDIFGNLPSDEDILAKKFNFPLNSSKEDFVLIANVGAYSLTFSTRFPYPLPNILLINKNLIKILHKSEDVNDFSLH